MQWDSEMGGRKAYSHLLVHGHETTQYLRRLMILRVHMQCIPCQNRALCGACVELTRAELSSTASKFLAFNNYNDLVTPSRLHFPMSCTVSTLVRLRHGACESSYARLKGQLIAHLTAFLLEGKFQHGMFRSHKISLSDEKELPLPK